MTDIHNGLEDPVEQFDEFTGLGALLTGVAARDRRLDAMAQMAFQQLALDLGQSGLDRLNLGQDVDAVSAILDHARDTAHLTLDTRQAV